MARSLYPIILAGGSGTRLWPLSRKNHPKQFLCLQGQDSLLQQTVKRVEALPYSELLLISNDAYYFLCQEQLAQTTQTITYLLEPCSRNTAPAVALAAYYLLQQGRPDAVMMILPSDHWIGDTVLFQETMLSAYEWAYTTHTIVTFGIKPDTPNTGFGYIETSDIVEQAPYLPIQAFHEKPDYATAQRFVEQGCYYWNSGMFVCRADVYLEELTRFAPDIAHICEQTLQHSPRHQDFIRLAEDIFAKCRSDSIDYAVMEKTQKAVMMPLASPWSDLGCWSSVAKANLTDEKGNTLLGKVIAQDSQNCFISTQETLVTTIGIQDQIIVATADAVLIADKKYSQDVKSLVDSLGEHAALAQEHRRVQRPWGWYEVLVEGSAFKVKRLMVKPGAKLSLQMHQHRAEHWVVVEGTAEVVRQENTFLLTANQSAYIPKMTQHRLSNAGKQPLYVIEVQSGHYLGEDDITRFDDIYAREALA